MLGPGNALEGGRLEAFEMTRECCSHAEKGIMYQRGDLWLANNSTLSNPLKRFRLAVVVQCRDVLRDEDAKCGVEEKGSL